MTSRLSASLQNLVKVVGTTAALLSISCVEGIERRSQLNDHWGLIGDFVFMRRSHSSNQILAEDSRKIRPGCLCDFTVLSTKELINDMGFEPGFRVGAIYRLDAKRSFEANCLYLQPWEAHKEREADGTLLYPFHSGSVNTLVILDNDPAIQNGKDFTNDYFDADRVKAEYHAHFWDLEFNYWRHLSQRWINYFSLSAIFGLRYFHYNERLSDAFYKRPPPPASDLQKSNYNIRTKNDMFGAQVGLDLQLNPLPYFSWEFITKFGFMMDHGQQRTLLRDVDNTVVLRHFNRQKWQNGIFADCMALIEFYFKDHINLHGGYQFLYFSGIATAEDQLSQKITSDAGKAVHTHGVAIIHGLFVGLMISF
jgi:hypothetical protein